MDKITWKALEYEEKERSGDWFWALGIVVVATSATAVIYNNYFFALLLLLSGVLLGFFAMKPPDEISYELDEKGFKAGGRFIPFENIKAFWINTEDKTKLFIRSSRVVMPELSAFLPPSLETQVRDIMLEHDIEETEIQEHHAEKVLDFFGF